MISFSEWVEIRENWFDNLKNKFMGNKNTQVNPSSSQPIVPKPLPAMQIFSAQDFEGIFDEFKHRHGEMNAEEFILKMLEGVPKGISTQNRSGLTDFAKKYGLQLYWIDGEKNRVRERVGDIIEKHGNLQGVDIKGRYPGYSDLYGNLTQIKPIIATNRFIVSWGEWAAH